MANLFSAAFQSLTGIVHFSLLLRSARSPCTRSDIQTAFDSEVEKFPTLKAAIKKELHAGKQKEPESEFDLTGWGMDFIRAALGDLAKKDPGATPKTKNH